MATTTTTSSSTLVIDTPVIRRTPRSRRSSFSSTATVNTESKPVLAKKTSTQTLKTRRGSNNVSEKRNTDFHALFKSVPEHDRLLDDYGCALQKEILLQGRLYVSEQHICFNSNIFGWVTNLVIAYEDITNIEKKSTAIFIPNAIQITTTSGKYFFASFLSRDQAFDQIEGLRQQRLSQRLRQTTKTFTLDVDESSSLASSSSSVLSKYSYESQSSTYSDDSVSPLDPVDPPVAPFAAGRQNSAVTLPGAALTEQHDLVRRRTASESQLLGLNDAAKNANASQKREHTACACTEAGGHYAHTVLDQVYDGTIEKIYGLLCNRAFMFKFLTQVEKNSDVDIGAWEKTDADQYARNICYIKHLNNSIGPKSTKCQLKEQVDHLDLQNYVTQVTTTQTPDVPSGSSFCVKTRICLMWAGQNKVRMLVTVVVEFSKSSWLKSTIEKASIDGQVSYFKNLDSAIRRHIQQPTVPAKHPVPENKIQHPHRRRRRHVRNHSRTTAANQAIHNKHTSSIYNALLESFKAGASAGADWVMQNRPAPSSNQIIVTCLLFLLCINIVIAVKLDSVSRKMVVQEQSNNNHYNSNAWDKHADKVWQWLDSQPTIMTKRIWELEQLVQHAGHGIEELMRQQQQHINDASNKDYLGTFTATS